MDQMLTPVDRYLKKWNIDPDSEYAKYLKHEGQYDIKEEKNDE